MKEIKTTSVIWMLGLIIIGLILIIVANNSIVVSGINISIWLSTIGSFLSIGAIFGFFFNYYSKDKLISELIQSISGSKSIFHSGVSEVIAISQDISYREAIENSNSITTIFTYSDGFIKKYESDLIKKIKSGATVTFVYVDRDSKILSCMIEMGWPKNSIDANYDTINQFYEKFKDFENFSVIYVDAIPRYAAVLFDEYIYIIEHTTSFGRAIVPAFKISRRGFLGEFYERDVSRLINGD